MSATLDPDKLNDFVGKMLVDMGAAIGAPLVLIGDKLGLYRALAEAPANPHELADRTSTNERYIREWLAQQAASGYVSYDATTARYFDIIAAGFRAEPRIADAFKSGKGLNFVLEARP